MIFLNPAVLFGLLATSIPILIHLINLRKLNKIEFSTLTFLKELQKTKIRKVKLKQWILLALRILIIIFLVSSFARPTLESVTLAGVSSSAKTSAVIILDNSFSMSVLTEKGSYFNQAKSVVKSLLKDFQEGDELIIIASSDLKSSEYEFSKNFNQIQTMLEEIEITDISGDLHSSIVSAGNALAGSQNINKEIYLLSDFQEGRIYNEESDLQDLNTQFNEEIKLYMFEFGGKDINNVSVTDLKINNQIFQKGKPLSFSAAITNFSNTVQDNIAASLFINGNRMAQNNLSLEPEAVKIINFETTLNETGLLEIFIEIEDDEIINDNKRYTAINIPEKIEIAIFADSKDDSHFIDLAINEGTAKGNFSVTKKVTSQLTSLNLNNFDLIFLIGSDNKINLTRLTDYIKNGGEVILMPSGKTSSKNYQQIINDIGINISGAEVGKINEIENYYSFEKVDFEHPLFYDMFEDNIKPKIESPDIYFYLQINSGGLGKTIISMPDRSAFLSEFSLNKGKAMVFNTAPVLSWSNFPLKGVFAPLLNRAVYYLISEKAEGKEIITGDELMLSLSDKAVQKITVVKPGNREEIISFDTLNNRKSYKFGNTILSGIYKILSEEKPIGFYPVNINPRESVAKYVDSDDIEKYLSKIGFNGVYYFIEPNENYNSIIYQARFGTELWRLFLLLAFLLAIIEMAVAKNSKKDVVEIT